MTFEYNYNPFTKEWEYIVNGAVIFRLSSEYVTQKNEKYKYPTEQKCFKALCILEVYNRIEKSEKFTVDILFKHLFK